MPLAELSRLHENVAHFRHTFCRRKVTAYTLLKPHNVQCNKNSGLSSKHVHKITTTERCVFEDKSAVRFFCTYPVERSFPGRQRETRHPAKGSVLSQIGYERRNSQIGYERRNKLGGKAVRAVHLLALSFPLDDRIRSDIRWDLAWSYQAILSLLPPPHPQFPHTPTIPTGLNPRRLTIATFIFRTKRTCTLNCPLTLCDAQDSSYRISSNMGADILLSDFSHTHAREILQLFFVQILVAMNLCHKSTKCQSGNVNSQPRKTTTGLCAAERISRSVVCFH